MDLWRFITEKNIRRYCRRNFPVDKPKNDRMIFRTRTSEVAKLDPYIESLTFFDEHSSKHRLDRFLPNGSVELIIDLNDTPQSVYDNETFSIIQTCRRGWLSGIRTKPITIPAGASSSMMIVVFKRGMASSFVNFPMNEVADLIIDADLIWGTKFLHVRDQIINEIDIDKKFETLENFLLEVCVENSRKKLITYSTELLDSAVSVSNVVETIGLSKKHFIGTFKKHVGLTPKAYMKIVRFQKAIKLIEQINPDNLDWALFALQMGFYDQSHFINNFKSLSGFTPGEYSKKKQEIPNYVPVA